MMSNGERAPAPPGSITIDQLLAINDEIAALIKAGVPLERGLLVAGRDVRGRLGQIAESLSQRLSRGESLPEAIEGEGRLFPPLYRAVVEAGARSGQLPIALEGMARYVRGYGEARAAIGLALWYPLLVLTLAYALFVGLVSTAVPRFVDAFESLRLGVAAPLRFLAWIGEWAPYWWPVGPVVLFILFLAWVRSGMATSFRAGSWSWLWIFPWMKSLLANYETANFAELLGLLLDHHVPYPSALVLAAESTGDARMARGARQLADGLTRGEPAAIALKKVDRKTFLPMTRWVLATGAEQGSLVAALHNLAEVYRKRAQYQSDRLAVFLPTVLMIGIGATATFLYALAVFIPLTNLLREITIP
jgi:type II secretory pathway component PulF